MGISFSCPFAAYNDLENGFQSIVVNAVDFGNDEAKVPERSISFKRRGSELTMLQSQVSQKMRMIEGSVSFKTTQVESTFSDVQGPLSNNSQLDSTPEKIQQLPVLDPNHPEHEAAIKLQKVYKSFRTRRKLADCAVLIEQSWWKLLDFAELKRSSISFFDVEKPETAVSRWSRARTRAAKVGKGLLKNAKAQKLALQHWLEAIDPRHRYGHNLHFYYNKWLNSQSREPFFYWLDIGEGKEINLVDKCPRSKLQQQCIKYLGPMERKDYEVVVEDGKLLYKQSGEFLDTTGEPMGAKWIFVLSTSMTLYAGQKKKGTFQHSSFLAGGATSAAGRLVVENGILKAVWPHSGHYRPTAENFLDFIAFLTRNNVDITDVKMDPTDDEEESLNKQSSVFLRSISSEEELSEKDGLKTGDMGAVNKNSEKTDAAKEDVGIIAARDPPQTRVSGLLQRKLTNLSIPGKDELYDMLKYANEETQDTKPVVGGYESSSDQDQMISGHYFSDEEDEEDKEEIPAESILKRINSHKGLNSYQLGKQLSCKWSTGAGPRIGCVRDYPSKLQCRALEQVDLSPRSAGYLRSFSYRESILDNFSGEIQIRKTSFSGELTRSRLSTPKSSLCKGTPTSTGVSSQS